MSRFEQASVLLLAREERLQRELFQAFDELGFDSIYSATDTRQALQQAASLEIDVLAAHADFPGEELERVRAQGRFAFSLVLIDPGAEERSWTDCASGFDQALRLPLVLGELDFRLERGLGAASDGAMLRRGLEAMSAGGLRGRRSVPDLLAQLGNALGLQVLLVLAGGQERQPVTVLAAWGRGRNVPDTDQLLDRKVLARLLSGRELVARGEAASRLLNTESARDAGQMVVGLPLTQGDGPRSGALLAVASRDDDDVLRVLRAAASLLSDRVEMGRLRRQRRERSLVDGPTGLPNRMLFNDRLAVSIKEADRTGEVLGIMIVDVDRFRAINDSLGDAAGDRILRAVAERLRESLRRSDTVARYASDQYTLIMRHVVSREDVKRTAEKLVSRIAEPMDIGAEGPVQVTASIGVSFFPDDGRTAEDVLRRADLAMSRAKVGGRNTSQVWSGEAEKDGRQSLLLESRLRGAQRRGELRVYYQPQLSVESEDIVGMEALIRWQHPELGLISPGFFVPLAEETGLIVAMGTWLLREACHEAQELQRRFDLPLTLGVNLSPLQLRQPDLASMVEKALHESGLHPRFLDLEVTESLSIKNIPGLRKTLEELRSLECRISIDDFGTGQSSLDYLKRFPADRIKIDQSFVRNIGIDPDDEAIVRATIGMAHQLNMEVVAEGVEQEEHLNFLRHHGCDEVQGFLFCRPLPGPAFAGMLEERERLASALPQR